MYESGDDALIARFNVCLIASSFVLSCASRKAENGTRESNDLQILFIHLAISHTTSIVKSTLLPLKMIDFAVHDSKIVHVEVIPIKIKDCETVIPFVYRRIVWMQFTQATDRPTSDELIIGGLLCVR